MTEKLTIESMAYEGAGIARSTDGKTVFVEGAVVGDVVKPLELRTLSSYDKCLSFELVEPSPHRIPNPCPYANVCSGCPWQILTYTEQLRWKRRAVIDALERIGGFTGAEELVETCVPSPREWHYRNKVELSAFVQNGRLGLGLKKKESQEHILIEKCLLLPERLVDMPRKLAGALNYSLKEGQENLARVAVRSSLKTGATEVALFMLPSPANRALLTKVLGEVAPLTSLVRVIIDGDLAARKVKKVEVLNGKGYWHEKLGANNYKISAPSFFQINSAIAEAMTERLAHQLNRLALPEHTHVADLYSGAGTFTIPLAQRFEYVSAIESYGSSIRDLRRNLEDSALQAEVIGGDVARELNSLEQAELAVIDPPRSGLRPEAVKAVLKYAPSHLVYVSCNPATLARDLRLLTAGGYVLDSATPFDQFPQSYHIEVMALLTRR